MYLASAFAAPPVFLHSPRVAALAARSSAVADVDVVTPTKAPSAANAMATNEGQQEQSVSRRMTAEDFAALQATMGIVREALRTEDLGFPGEVTPAELLEVIDREDDLAVVRTAEPHESRDFSDAVADAVVTVDEYLDWVLEAGLGRR